MAPRPTKRLNHTAPTIRRKPYAACGACVCHLDHTVPRFFYDTRHPTAMGRADIEAVLTHPVVAIRVSHQPVVEFSTDRELPAGIMPMNVDCHRP